MIAAVGREDIISVFKIYGVECHPVEGPGKDAAEVFGKLYKKNYRIIFVTEDVYSKCSHIIEDDRTYPQVTVLPDNRGSAGLGAQRIKKLVIKAIGADILIKT